MFFEIKVMVLDYGFASRVDGIECSLSEYRLDIGIGSANSGSFPFSSAHVVLRCKTANQVYSKQIFRNHYNVFRRLDCCQLFFSLRSIVFILIDSLRFEIFSLPEIFFVSSIGTSTSLGSKSETENFSNLIGTGLYLL